MARARLELGTVGGCSGRVLPIVGRGQEFGQRAVCWVALKPALVPAAVRELELRRGLLLGRELLQVLQRIGGPASAAGRGAGQSEAFYQPRAGDGELLRHHPAEAHPEHPAGVPRNELQQASGVSGEIGHGVGTGQRDAATQATVVPRQQVELASKQIKHRPNDLQGRARPVAEQQAGTTAVVLPVQLNPVHMINRHAEAPSTLVGPTFRSPTLPSRRRPLIAHGGCSRWEMLTPSAPGAGPRRAGSGRCPWMRSCRRFPG
jgi:hypothetical protein